MTSKIKLEVQELLRNMIAKEVHVIDGCAQLTAYLHAGHDFIYWDFDEYYSKLLEFPHPTTYHLWEPEILESKLKEFEKYKELVIQLATQLVEELQCDE